MYIKSLAEHHCSRWPEYQALLLAEKDTFFNSTVPVMNHLNARFVGDGDQLFLYIDAPIVDTTTCRLLFDPNANDETVESPLEMLESMHGAAGEENTVSHYRVHINNMKLFNLVFG